MHLGLLCILQLSGERPFAAVCNQACPQPLPERIHHSAADASAGCLGDLLVGTVAALVLPPTEALAEGDYSRALAEEAAAEGGGGGGGGEAPPLPARRGDGGASSMLLSIQPAALAILANVAPHVKEWSYHAVYGLLRMAAALASPPVYFSSPTAPELLHGVLDTLTTSLLYSHQSNGVLLQGLLLHAPLLRGLAAIPLPARLERDETFTVTAGWHAGWCARLAEPLQLSP